MKVATAVTTVFLFCVLSLLASSQDQGHQSTAKPQLQVFFAKLETQWQSAIQDKDQAAINRIVSDDFHLWTSTQEKPISREDWLLGVFGRKSLALQLRQVTARGLNPEIAVVSFVQTETYQQSATPQTESHFIVDVWINTGTGDNWRCTDRYLSEVKGIPVKK
jgi:Domain of unknown function (DUF4440)